MTDIEDQARTFVADRDADPAAVALVRGLLERLDGRDGCHASETAIRASAIALVGAVERGTLAEIGEQVAWTDAVLRAEAHPVRNVVKNPGLRTSAMWIGPGSDVRESLRVDEMGQPCTRCGHIAGLHTLHGCSANANNGAPCNCARSPRGALST